MIYCDPVGVSPRGVGRRRGEEALPEQLSLVEPVAADATRVLIVDDDASVRDVIGVLLSEEGYQCTVAEGAQQALDTARHTQPHLVISDVKMPGKDGFWLLDRLRKEHPDTAVVMLTAFGDTEAAGE